MGLLDDLGSWLDQKKRNVAANAQNLPGLLASFAQDVQQGAAADKSAWDASRSVMPGVREAGIREMNARGQELGGLLGTFAGVGAKTADVVKLAKAKEMVKAGADPVKVWQETGWTDQFPDGKWRFEIPDNTARSKQVSMGDINLSTPSDVKGAMSHAKLFAAYPDLKSTPFVKYKGNGASLEKRIGSSLTEEDVIRMGDLNYVQNIESAPRSVLLHELQHAVQQREGFARGGSPDAIKAKSIPPDVLAKMDQLQQEIAKAPGGTPERFAAAKAFDDLLQQYTPHGQYRRLAGEAEARLTQKRMNLTPAERAARPPWLEFDVPREQQIVRGLLGEPTGPAMSVDDELIKRAKQHFGTTYSPAETGYILPDGTRLDLSGRHYAQGYQQQGERYVPQPGQPDYLRGGRNTDHRELPDTLSALHGTDAMIDFMNRSGAVRYMPDVGATVVDTAPVKMKQIQALVRDFRSHGAPLNVDISTAKGGDKVAKEFSRPTVESVADWLKRNGVNVSALGVLGLLGAGAYGQDSP